MNRRSNLAVTILLFLGFCGLALAIWLSGMPWVGLLLPLSFLAAVIADR